MIQYILESIAFQLLFLIIYDVVLKRETFFQWNRVYLIGTYVLSLALPWVRIEALKTSVTKPVVTYSELLWNTNNLEMVVTSQVEIPFVMPWKSILVFGGMFFALGLFLYKLHQIRLLRQKGEVQYMANFTQIIIKNSEVAFSFFKSIFLGDKVVSQEHESIIQHELVHIRQGHSYDLVFFEIFRIVNWFNPLVYVYQRRISELHEFIADAQVAKTHKKEHYQLLLSQVFQTQHISFINPFFKTSLIKKRIVMLQKSKSKKIFQLKYLVLVPLVLGMLIYTSAAPESALDTYSLEQDIEDAALIKKVTTEIDQEVFEFGSVQAAYYNFNPISKDRDPNFILQKEQYFKSEIFNSMFFDLIFEEKKKEGSEILDIEKLIQSPTSAGYNTYVNRKKALQILDDNLKISLSAYSQDVIILDSKNDYPEKYILVQVEDVKGLTADEIREFNHIIDDISKNNKLESIVLTDGTYSFNIYQKKYIRVEEYEASEVQETITRNGSTITYRVADVQQMTSEEIVKRKELVDEMLNSETYGTLVITDGKMKTIIGDKTVSEDEIQVFKDLLDVPFAKVDQVPVFPGCENAADKRECFQEKMYEHISRNFRYPEAAQEKGIQGRVNLMFVIDGNGVITNLKMRGPDKLLEDETERIITKLPKMTPGKQKGKAVRVPFSIPITFKLADNDAGFKEININLSKDNQKLKNTINTFNSLLKERDRLLNSSNKENPIIKNLDNQLRALKIEISEKLNIASLNINDQISEKLESSMVNNTTDIPFSMIEEAPIYPGCENEIDIRACFQESIYKHISKNFRYPLEAQELGIQGKVNTMFLISKEGAITNIKMRGPSKLLEDETKRILNLLPKMKPGKQKGKEVNVPFSVPITFRLKGETDFDLIPETLKNNYPNESKSIDQYNELLTERRRLLKSSYSTNPIIENLDKQLNALKILIANRIVESKN